MRHAKAEQSESKRDIDRVLTDRGQADAEAAGAWLGAQDISPDAVLCSPAARTRGTWFGVAIGLGGGSATVAYEADLYYGGVSTMLDHVREVDDSVRTLLVIGHNPTVSGLSMRLDDVRIRAAGGLRTAGIAVHRVTDDWSSLTSAPLAAEHTPRA
jgi:phosphohistidine phosphatase